MIKFLSERRLNTTIVFWALFILIITRLAILVVYSQFSDVPDAKKLYDMYSNELFTFVATVLNTAFVFGTILEMRATRNLEFDPKLTVKLEPYGLSMTVVRIKNIGSGHAQNIKMGYEIKRASQSFYREWGTSIIWPNEEEKLLIEELFFTDFLRKYDSMTFTLTYYNQSGTLLKNKTTLNLKEILTNITENFQFWEPDENYLKGIGKSMDDIKSSLDKISKNIEYLSEDSKKRIERERNLRMKDFIEKGKGVEQNNNKK